MFMWLGLQSESRFITCCHIPFDKPNDKRCQMYLYKISFPEHLTTKCYIGITSQTLKKRFKSHCYSSNCSLISRAIKKYGKNSAIMSVIAECDNWELLCLAEQEAIEKFNTISPNGYNLTLGGEGLYGHVFSEQHKDRISKANIGKTMSKESRELMSISGKNKVFSPEHLRKFRENHIKGETHHRFGKGMPEHIAEALLKANLGRKQTEDHKQKVIAHISNRSIDTKLKMSKSNRDRANRPCKNNSGYQGVYYMKSMGKFRARCVHMKKEHALGFFDTAEEAAAAYQNFVATL